MKTIYLIKSIEPSLHSRIKQRLKENKRESLIKIYNFLQKWIIEHADEKFNQEDKEKLFKKIFSYKYDDSKDYLLRNELRILNQELRDLIDQYNLEQFSKENSLEMEIMYLKHLLKSGQYKLFEAEIEQVIETAKSELRPDILSELAKLNANYLIQAQEIDYDLYLKIRNLIADGIYCYEQMHNEKYEEWKRWYAFSERTLLTLNSAHQPRPYQSIKSEALPDLNPVSDFLHKAALSYSKRGEEAIRLLTETLHAFEEHKDLRPQYKGTVINLYNNLAVEYLLERNYIKADETFKRTIPLLDSHDIKLTSKLSIIFNYCSNAMRLNRYSEVIETFEKQHESLLKEARILYRFRRIAAMSYLFTGNAAKALELMYEEQLSHRPEADYHYGRIIFALSYFETSDLESSERELFNLLQSFRYKSPGQSSLEPVVKLLKKFVQCYQLPNGKIKDQHYHKLSKELNEEIQKNNDAGNLPLQWLKLKLENYPK